MDVMGRTFVEGGMRGEAIFSSDETYRYLLSRQWETGTPPAVGFVMLNPSTATETVADPSIRRCIGFAKDWGYGKLVVANAFALRATDPKELKAHRDPVGPDNNAFLESLVALTDLIIVAWGAHATLYGRDREVRRLLERSLEAAGRLNTAVRHLGLTGSGQPRHPLYLPKGVTPMRYLPERTTTR